MIFRKGKNLVNEKEIKPYGSVLVKGVQILDVLSKRSTPQSMSEISEATEITMSTTNKTLDTLELLGLVNRDSKTKKYVLGPRLIQLANAASIQFEVARTTYPILKHLYDSVGTTVNLGMLDDNQILFLNKFSTRDSYYETVSRIGFKQAIHCSAMGKAILADLSPAEQEKYYREADLVANTEYTITSVEKLRKEIKTIKDQGYAIDNREAEENIFCVGTTIQVKGDSNKYAFSISSLYSEIDETRKAFLIEAVKRTKTILEYEIDGMSNP